MNKLVRFHCLPFHMKLMLPEALYLSAWYRFAILHRPFSEISKKIGNVGIQTNHAPINNAIPNEVGWVVDVVCKHTPWKSKCLVRALTAKKMLNHRHFPCTLYMGVQINHVGEMEAHAWLRCGNLYVTGGTGEGYTVTTIFGDADKLK